MQEKEITGTKLRPTHLVCLALWSVLTVMATAALTQAVSIPPRADTAVSTPAVTE